MNEKFLSRGKRKDNGEWVEGYYVELPEDQHGKNFCLIIGLDGQYNRIVPETAGRCTGLTDKNGKMIFARDIVRVKKFNNDPIIGKVVFNENTAGFEVWWDIVVGAYGEKATRKENFAVCGQMEVIGNIHDNPEMLSRADMPVSNDVFQPVFQPTTP